MPRVCVFDVNETLLDLAAPDPRFERVFGDRAARREWFQQMLQSAFVGIVTDAYADFGSAGRAALDMIAERRGVRLTDDDRQLILRGMRELPPHPEVREALDHLKAAGLHLATLTNSTLQTAEAQLAYAGLRDVFDHVLSADTVRRLKPAPEPYRHAAERMGVSTGQIRLVAAHPWDIAGALRAGCVAAFVARPGAVLDPLAPRPDVVGRDLRDVARKILQWDRG